MRSKKIPLNICSNSVGNMDINLISPGDSTHAVSVKQKLGGDRLFCLEHWVKMVGSYRKT
jgi:hypothetical protein